jgi:hypothetical protein
MWPQVRSGRDEVRYGRDDRVSLPSPPTLLARAKAAYDTAHAAFKSAEEVEVTATKTMVARTHKGDRP